jgi:hypothetical protein
MSINRVLDCQYPTHQDESDFELGAMTSAQSPVAVDWATHNLPTVGLSRSQQDVDLMSGQSVLIGQWASMETYSTLFMPTHNSLHTSTSPRVYL